MSTGIYLKTRIERNDFIKNYVANNGFLEIIDRGPTTLQKRVANLTTVEALNEAAHAMLARKQDFGQVICPLKKSVMAHSTGEQVHYLMNTHRVENGRSDLERDLRVLKKNLSDLLNEESVDENAVTMTKEEIATVAKKIDYFTKLLDLPRIETGIPGIVAFCTTN